MVFEETNVVLKSIEDIDIRFALISPNEYNLAMQTLDYQLLYQFLNERKDCFCERIIYPSVESILIDGGADLVRENAVTTGNIITSRAMGTAIPFALAIVEHYLGKEKADDLGRNILYYQ